jgi:hypothetical protein
MASLYTSEILPQTSEEAIRQFDEKYLAVSSAAPPSTIADRFITTVGAPRVTYPLSAMTTKFLETKERASRFKSFEEKEFDLKVVEFDAGYEVSMLDLRTEVFAARNWAAAPGRFRTAETRHMAFKLAALLEAGTSTLSPWDDVNFFATTHLANPFGAAVAANQFSNYQSAGTAPTLANIQLEMIAMSTQVKDENGDKLGAMAKEIWLPTEKFQTVSDLLNQAQLASGESNYMKGKLTAVHVPELTDVNDWYLVDTDLLAAGYEPMIAAKYQEPSSLGLRYWDESSDFFKDTGKIKVSQHIWTGFGLVFPHAIRKVVGA